jgi:hypothetical protein
MSKLKRALLILVGVIGTPLVVMGYIYLFKHWRDGYNERHQSRHATRTLVGKRAEVKAALGGIYSAEWEYHQRKKTYTSCISDLVDERLVSFSAEGPQNYFYGFLREQNDQCKVAHRAPKVFDPKLVPVSLTTYANQDGFLAVAVGCICCEKQDGRPDIWSIDESGKYVNIQDGSCGAR